MRGVIMLGIYLTAMPFLMLAMVPLWLGYQFCSLMARLVEGRAK